mgnify:CR=1 FL=1
MENPFDRNNRCWLTNTVFSLVVIASSSAPSKLRELHRWIKGVDTSSPVVGWRRKRLGNRAAAFARPRMTICHPHASMGEL